MLLGHALLTMLLECVWPVRRWLRQAPELRGLCVAFALFRTQFVPQEVADTFIPLFPYSPTPLFPWF